MAGVLTATIMGREGTGASATGQVIEFAAVAVANNPAGATAAQIQGATGAAARVGAGEALVDFFGNAGRRITSALGWFFARNGNAIKTDTYDDNADYTGNI